jgi:ComF family protein
MLHQLWLGALDLLAPPGCAACDTPLAARSEAFCGACAPLLEALSVVAGALPDRAALAYGGPVAEAIGRLKYRRESHLAPGLARLLLPQARAFGREVDVVTAVPLSARRLRERGFNQSALLAWPVARALGARFRPGLLRRKRDTSRQVGLDPAERRRQLQGTFHVASDVRTRAVLVIDDVRTTGSTLAEARRALQAAGAGSVYTLTLAERVFEPHQP